MGKAAMKPELIHDKITDVAFVDFYGAKAVCPVQVIDVTDDLGLKSQVLARVADDGTLLGVVIENYGAFRREVRVKYAALAVDRIIELILNTVKGLVQSRSEIVHAHC